MVGFAPWSLRRLGWVVVIGVDLGDGDRGAMGADV